MWTIFTTTINYYSGTIFNDQNWTGCRSNIHSYLGHRPNLCPGILGHEIVGTIEQLGKNIRRDLCDEPLALGNRITWTTFFNKDRSYYRGIHAMPQKSGKVRKYGHDLANKDPHFLAGFAEYCYLLPETGLLNLLETVSDEEATPLNCEVATMVSVTNAAKIKLGDTVFVQGLGLS